MMDMPRPRSSANGTDSQIPLYPIICGKSKIDNTRKTKVLNIEINAEILPFENAVNNADAKILNPVKAKLIANNINPSFAILNTSVFGLAKIPINTSSNYIDTTIISMDEIKIINILILKYFFIFR